MVLGLELTLLQQPGEAAVQVPELEWLPLVLGQVLQQQRQQLGEAAGLALQLPGLAAEQVAVPTSRPGLQRVQVRLLQLWPSLQQHTEMSVGSVS